MVGDPTTSPTEIARGSKGGRPVGSERHLLASQNWRAVGGYSGAIRAAYDLREPVQQMAQGGYLGDAFGRSFRDLRWRYPDDRQLYDPGAPACRQWQKKATRSRRMGRSRGGLTTKIHALVDALGRPIRLKLTEGQAHDGRSAEDMFATLGPGSVLLADRAYDSDALRTRLAKQGAWGNILLMPNRVRFPVFVPIFTRRETL